MDNKELSQRQLIKAMIFFGVILIGFVIGIISLNIEHPQTQTQIQTTYIPVAPVDSLGPITVKISIIKDDESISYYQIELTADELNEIMKRFGIK